MKALWLFASACGLAATVAGTSASAQTTEKTIPPSPEAQKAARAAQQAAAHEDHTRLLNLLKITSLRPGADGYDAKSPNFVNYDETKAGPIVSLPDPLVMKNGKPVTSAKQWPKRRAEIAEDFSREVYGRVPQNVPSVHWEVVSQTPETVGGIAVITKHLRGVVDNKAYPSVSVALSLTLTTPAKASGPVPVIMQLMFAFPAGFKPSGAFAPPPGPTWQEQALRKGWGYAVYVPTSTQPDNGAGLTQGIIGLTSKGQPRRLEDWGALRAWAWGASRCLDYFETDHAVNARAVGIEGHSRYGKAALITTAYDTRFAIAYVSSSGAGGAALWRRDFGERLENVANEGEYHWMAGNFLKYAGPLHPADLPVDSHELIALCAPRPVFLGAGITSGDGWVDARGSFLSASFASPVYDLLGGKGLGTDKFPPAGTGITEGDLAFRQHDGGHTDAPNWPVFLEFAGRYLDAGPPAPQ